jgi:hypothetical protein
MWSIIQAKRAPMAAAAASAEASWRGRVDFYLEKRNRGCNMALRGARGMDGERALIRSREARWSTFSV